MIVGSIPDPAQISVLDYSILREVIDKIKHSPLHSGDGNLTVPDWDKKIQFNELSRATNIRLLHGSLHINNLNKYLDNQSRFTAEELRNRLREIYLSEKMNWKGDQLFWKIVAAICPEQTFDYQNAAIVIMAKYFETCDIFEEPQE